MTKPKSSPWHATPQSRRHRKVSNFTLSQEAKDALAVLAKDRNMSHSRFIESLIFDSAKKLGLLSDPEKDPQ